MQTRGGLGYLNPPAAAAPSEPAIPEAPAGQRFVASTVVENPATVGEKRAAIGAAIDSEEPLMTRLTTEELEELLGWAVPEKLSATILGWVGLEPATTSE